MKRNAWLLILVVGLQVLWMVATAMTKEHELRSGAVVLLETMPVDPRDWLRGDYVTLNYAISRLPARLFAGLLPAEKSQGKAVYVLLEKQGQFHHAVSASLDALAPANGQIMVRGTIEWADSNRTSGDVRVRYGIERYYVPEGEGNLRGKVTVRAAVAKDGAVLIKELMLDGKPFKQP